MKIQWIVFALVASFMLVPAARSEETIGNVKETYCGSGATKIFVPDRFLGCDFTEACRLHDICYGRCGKDGDLVGSSYCELLENSAPRKQSKKDCDNALRDDIIKVNQDKPFCKIPARVYRLAVKLFGQGPFNGRVIFELYENALKSSATEDDADARVEAILSLQKSGVIDLSKITFDATQIKMPTLKPINSKMVRDPNLIVITKGLDKAKVAEIGQVGGD
jgi:hypothetical protein